MVDDQPAAGPTVAVATYPDYVSAQRAVDYLSDNKFPVERTAIIGTDRKELYQVGAFAVKGYRLAVPQAGSYSVRLLMAEEIGPDMLRERDPRKLIPPLHGALLKNEQDVSLFEKLAFMNRREGR